MSDCSDSLFVEHAWSQHENLVRFHVWRIIKKYGGDFDELFSEALCLFVQAMEVYEPIAGTVQSWINFTIYKGLLEVKRTEARRLRITGPVSDDLSSVYCRQCFLEELYKDLSTDSQDVLSLLFALDVQKFKNKSLAKLTLRQTLKDEMNWTNERINECFKEIEDAL